MDLITLMIRLVLATVFAAAGFAKLADLKGSKKAFQDFGVPETLALPGSVLLSVAEIAIAVLLIFPAYSWLAAVGAAILLTVFIAQMAFQYANGNAPDCHCFGQLHSEPVGIKSIVRNVAFLSLTVFVLIRGVRGQGPALWDLRIDVMPTVLGTLLVIMMGGALIYLRKLVAMQDELRRRLDVLELVSREGLAIDHEHASDPLLGLPIGALVPEMPLKTLEGERVLSREFIKASEKPTLLFFVSPTCGPCDAMLPDIAVWRGELSDRVQFIFVSNGTPKNNRKKFETVSDSPILIDDDRTFALSVGGKWTPTALFVDRSGRTASHVAAGDSAIEELIEQIGSADLSAELVYFSNGGLVTNQLKIGNEAPDFSLTDVTGRNITKNDIRGKRTLATFWSVGCPHCQAFLNDLKAWERSPAGENAGMIVFSDGSDEQHRDLGFSSPVLTDKGYQVATRLGMSGTPSAVMLDENGVIVSEIAIGADNILALLGVHRNGSR